MRELALIEQGKKAYMFGIEPCNNPLKETEDRRLWDIGYKKGKDELGPLIQRLRWDGRDRERKPRRAPHA